MQNLPKKSMSKTKFAFVLLGLTFLGYIILSLLYPEHSEHFAKGFQVLWTGASVCLGGL